MLGYQRQCCFMVPKIQHSWGKGSLLHSLSMGPMGLAKRIHPVSQITKGRGTHRKSAQHPHLSRYWMITIATSSQKAIGRKSTVCDPPQELSLQAQDMDLEMVGVPGMSFWTAMADLSLPTTNIQHLCPHVPRGATLCFPSLSSKHWPRLSSV